MSFKNKLKHWWGRLRDEFLPYFFLASSFSLALLHFISAEAVIISDEDLLLPWAFGLLLSAFLLWYFYKAPEEKRANVRHIAKIAFPLTLAFIVIFSLISPEWYEDLHLYAVLLLLAECVVYFLYKREAAPALQRSNKFYRAAAFAIIALGIILCAREAYMTSTISVDEAHSSISAYGILSRGFPYFPNTEVIYSRSWVDLYSIAISYKLFGFSEFSARIPSVAAYALAITLLYLILKRTVSPAAGIVALALLALNPWILHYGSYARMYIFLLLFSMLFAYLLIRYLETKDKRMLYIFLPLAIIGGLFSERSFMLFAPPYALLVLFSLPRTLRFWKKALLYAGMPLALIALGAFFTAYPQIVAFVERYVIGFGGGGGLLEYARVAYTPVEWLSYFGLPTILLILSTAAIILRGSAKERIILAVFWFGEFLVDILVYSNFPARRFNYTFIIVSLYALVIAFGFSILSRIVPKWQKAALAAFIIAFCGYHYLFSYSFPTYADFGKVREIPPGSLVLGYPTSPSVFYNIKYDRGNDIRPFITDRIEMEKYVDNGTEIYSGGVPVMGVTPLNALRAERDVYLFYEKTRFDFLNDRTETYIFANCQPIDDQVAADAAWHVANSYQFSDEDGETRNTLIALKCPRLEAGTSTIAI